MTDIRRVVFVITALALGAVACNLGAVSGSSTGDASPSPPPTEADEPTAAPEGPTAAADDPTSPPEPTSSGGQAPPAATTGSDSPVTTADEVCLTAGEGESLYVNEAGGYCFLVPADFEITQDTGLDIFAVGPILAEFGMEGIALAFGFSVIGAPGGAGDYTAQSWGEQVVEETGGPDFEPNIEPYTLSGAGLDGVRVGPLPGMVGGEAAYVRTNDTLYGVTVYPERVSFPEYADQANALWAQLSESIRFFTPVDTGVDYNTPGEVCPAEESGTRLVIRHSEGWCVLIPDDWHEDIESNFPGRFVGGPEIGSFWPGQPPYANITIGYSGPASDDITLDQQAEGRANANGRPDLVQRTDAEIGGYPAVILDTEDGPILDRVALIHTTGGMYSVLGQPFDEENFPDAQPALEAAWDTMINSIGFFEPYR
jgi:hypothetical protein